uniref:Uncharacterized protein n=1 Tax=Parascaris equorum TaxID=6256 RepID=A0A914S290_PAREQ
MIPVFILSRIVQFAMPYMLILATFERLVWTAASKGCKFPKDSGSGLGRRDGHLIWEEWRLVGAFESDQDDILLRIASFYADQTVS